MKNKQRILAIHSGGADIRGAELVLLAVLCEFRDLGREVLLLCDQPTLVDAARARGLASELIPYGGLMIDTGAHEIHPIGLLRANLAVHSHCRRFQPQVVYCNGGRAMQMALFAGKLFRSPMVVHLHARYSKRYLFGFGITAADVVIHCCDALRNQHDRSARFRRSVSIPNGMDLARFPDMLDLKRPSVGDVPTIGFIGSLIPRKGVDILLAGLRSLLDTHLECRLKIGGVELDTTYRDQVNELGLGEHVTFVGEVAQGAIPEFFSDVTIHALPTRSDAMPLSIIEAALCGVPSAVHDVGGVRESLGYGRFGIAYSPNTPERLADVLRSMLSEGSWTSLEKSRDIAADSRLAFDVKRNAIRFAELLDSLA